MYDWCTYNSYPNMELFVMISHTSVIRWREECEEIKWYQAKPHHQHQARACHEKYSILWSICRPLRLGKPSEDGRPFTEFITVF